MVKAVVNHIIISCKSRILCCKNHCQSVFITYLQQSTVAVKDKACPCLKSVNRLLSA